MKATAWVHALARYFGCPPGDVLVVLATLLLVAATILLVWATFRSVAILRTQRKAAIRPVVIVRSDGTRACMLNVGSGMAVNVAVWVTDARGGLYSHQRAEAIASDVPHWPPSWNPQGNPRDFGKGVVLWIRYQNAEGDLYYSHRDYNRQWTLGIGRGPELAGGWEGKDDTGMWEQAG